MGQAWKPPKTARDFRFWISMHAIERFRERVDDQELRSRADRDLAMLLDERICDAMLQKNVTEVIDTENPDVDTKIVWVESRSGTKYAVVMRPYRPSMHPPMRVVGGPGGLGLAAITVLSQEMASNNFNGGKWHVPNRPFADKLRLIKIEERVEEKKAPPPPPSPTPAPVPIARIDHKPESPKRGASTVERNAFAMQILRERPHINAAGPDGLSEILRAKFGAGMSPDTIAKLRAQVGREQGHPGPIPATLPVLEVRAAPVANTEAPSVALQFAQAIEAEKMARARRDAAQRELEASQSVLDGASRQVETLLAQMQAQRGVA